MGKYILRRKYTLSIVTEGCRLRHERRSLRLKRGGNQLKR